MFILFVGWWFVGKIGNVVENLMIGCNIDIMLSCFIGGVCKIFIFVFVIIIVFGNIGISVMLLIVVIGVVGLGVGLVI